MQEDVLRREKEFAQAMVKNDAEAVGRFLTDDWIIVDPDGGSIERARFLAVIQSGALTHEMMESDDMSVRIYGNTAIVTALTTTKGSSTGTPSSRKSVRPMFLCRKMGDGNARFRTSRASQRSNTDLRLSRPLPHLRMTLPVVFS